MKPNLKIYIILWCLLMANTIFAFDRQDTLRGSNGKHRAWWDVQHYALNIVFDTAKKSISGSSEIEFTVMATPTDSLQLDLQELMFLDSVMVNGTSLDFHKEGNVWWITYPFYKWSIGDKIKLTAYYHGMPRIARKAPWDGGFIYTKDSLEKLWVAVACQGTGASLWWPCKDYQGDEPDSGATIQLYFPCQNLEGIANGNNLAAQKQFDNNLCVASWQVKNPINNYDVTFYLGNYTYWTDTLMGENGVLNLSFYVLKQNKEKAVKHFSVTKQMLRCFEYWMGPYPFYADGYKLVEAPYLGMEHQSAIAYGNNFKLGYNGTDRSRTGVGMLFDFIIIHESGHEWFGNNITAKDIADNWIHEGFTTYTETLFAEWIAGKEKAFEYCRGEWRNIRNDKPVIGKYGVNDEGSGDKYDKGAAVVHMIRMILHDDEKFRQLLRGLNKDFYHGIVTTQQVETYINQFSGYDFSPLFNQYLRTTQIPVLEYYIKGKKLFYRFTNVVEKFSLPLTVKNGKHQAEIQPESEWQNIKWKGGYGVEFSKDFLFEMK